MDRSRCRIRPVKKAEDWSKKCCFHDQNVRIKSTERFATFVHILHKSTGYNAANTLGMLGNIVM